MKTRTKFKTYKSLADWQNRGRELFGDKTAKWRFRCPICGNVQSVETFLAIGVDKETTDKAAYFSCIGRWMPDCKGTMSNGISPCDYTCGGLFRFGDRIEENDCIVFPFDEPETENQNNA